MSNRYAGERVVVRLGRPATLRGRVRRASDGTGVAGAILRGWTDDNAFYTVFSGETEDDGSFVFEDLPACHIGLQVMPPDDSPLPWIRVDLVGGGTTTVDVPVARGLRVTGRIVDAETGLPIEGATVALGWRFNRPTTTDAEGRYELRGFSAAGHYEVHVSAPAYAQGSRLPPPFASDRAEVDVALVKERRVTGARPRRARCVPVVGAYVAVVGRLRTAQNVPNVDCRSARTDADGRYEVGGLRRGMRHSLFVLSEGHGSVAYELPLRSLDEPLVRVPDVRLGPAHLLRGVVVDEQGRALPDCQVSVRGVNSDYARFAPALEGRAARRPRPRRPPARTRRRPRPLRVHRPRPGPLHRPREPRRGRRRGPRDDRPALERGRTPARRARDRRGDRRAPRRPRRASRRGRHDLCPHSGLDRGGRAKRRGPGPRSLGQRRHVPPCSGCAGTARARGGPRPLDGLGGDPRAPPPPPRRRRRGRAAPRARAPPRRRARRPVCSTRAAGRSRAAASRRSIRTDGASTACALARRRHLRAGRRARLGRRGWSSTRARAGDRRPCASAGSRPVRSTSC